MHERSQQQDIVIVFQQELPVQLVNISRSGCLLQVSRPVRVGTVGRLRIAIEDQEYADDVRVARCEFLQGTACALGVELLWVPKLNEPRRGAPSLARRLRASSDEPISRELGPKQA